MGLYTYLVGTYPTYAVFNMQPTCRTTSSTRRSAKSRQLIWYRVFPDTSLHSVLVNVHTTHYYNPVHLTTARPEPSPSQDWRDSQALHEAASPGTSLRPPSKTRNYCTAAQQPFFLASLDEPHLAIYYSHEQAIAA